MRVPARRWFLGIALVATTTSTRVLASPFEDDDDDDLSSMVDDDDDEGTSYDTQARFQVEVDDLRAATTRLERFAHDRHYEITKRSRSSGRGAATSARLLLRAPRHDLDALETFLKSDGTMTISVVSQSYPVGERLSQLAARVKQATARADDKRGELALDAEETRVRSADSIWQLVAESANVQAELDRHSAGPSALKLRQRLARLQHDIETAKKLVELSTRREQLDGAQRLRRILAELSSVQEAQRRYSDRFMLVGVAVEFIADQDATRAAVSVAAGLLSLSGAQPLHNRRGARLMLQEPQHHAFGLQLTVVEPRTQGERETVAAAGVVDLMASATRRTRLLRPFTRFGLGVATVEERTLATASIGLGVELVRSERWFADLAVEGLTAMSSRESRFGWFASLGLGLTL